MFYDTTTMTAEEMAAAVAAADAKKQRDAQEAIDSFERCDTDGFLSQWASGICSREASLWADILRNGGKAEFPALFNLAGERVRAKLFAGKFGTCWMFCDANDKPTGKFITAFPAREATMRKKGYVEGVEMVFAGARIAGSGRGLSGTAWAEKYRRDNGYPADAKVE
jgi:hypothetical protein